MENKIPTAEEFGENLLPRGITWYSEFERMMIEFAKLHVKAALEAALKHVVIEYEQEEGSCSHNIDPESILNAYPETNIV